MKARFTMGGRPVGCSAPASQPYPESKEATNCGEACGHHPARKKARAELEPFIRAWLQGESDELPSNPLIRFYNIPLVDISAVAGIALGYAENFIAPLMTAIQGPIEQSHEGKRLGVPVGVVVVLPQSLDNLSEEEGSVRKGLEAEFGGNGALCTGFTASTSYGARTISFYVSGAFVDIPRTLLPLRRSRRVQRLRDHNNASWKVMERKLIDGFCRNLQKEAEARSDISVKRLHIVRMPELTRTLRGLQSA